MRPLQPQFLKIAAVLMMASMALLTASNPAALGQTADPAPLAGIKADGPFWAHWGDGQAELAGYDLIYPRYNEKRHGVAVTIFVTETFSNALRVKADPGKHPKTDEFAVMKLNLIQDFTTGIYDYNLMTSTFVALDAIAGCPAGSTTKVSFSTQEWCGHAYQQLKFAPAEARVVEHVSHSYFDGEADQQEKIEYPSDGISEDSLLLWARGLAAPVVESGKSRQVRVLRSLAASRLNHVPLVWQNAMLSGDAAPKRIKVPAGEFEVEVCRAVIDGGRTWTFFVEKKPPHRLVRWEASDGQQAELLASERLKYWQMNGGSFREAVKKLGITPRPDRTP